jgi:DNA polymerase-3 subunit gamma/tau
VEATESSSEFVERYRPRKFGQIVGQPVATDTLSEWARQRLTHPVILYGPRGSGKTSLARIYAHSFLCSDPAADGSPCGECERCQDSLGYEQVTSLTRESLRSIGSTTGGSVLSMYKVFFFDEAQRLAGAPFDELLESLEFPLTVYIFATTDLSRIPETIRTRCKKVPTQGVSNDELRSLAARIAAIENIDLREEVLDVIVPFAAGDARAIVHSLWDIKLFALLNAKAARTHFGQSEASLAMELLEGAVGGIATSELLVISRRSLVSPSLLQTTIHALLHNIYATRFLMLSERNAAFDAIEEGRKAAFSQTVKDHALAASVRLDRLWERLVHDWDPAPDLTRAALENRMSRFRSMFEDMRIFERPNLGLDSHKPTRKLLAFSRLYEPSQEHLSLEQTRSIWNAASFLVQGYGVTLNGRIDLKWTKLGVLAEADAKNLTSKFRHDLGSFVMRSKALDQHYAYLYVREHYAIDGHRTLFIFHVSRWLFKALKKFTERWLAANAYAPMESFSGVLSLDDASEQRPRFKRHRRLLRDLSGGVDPGILVPDESNRPIPLVDALGIPMEDRRAIGRLNAKQRFRVSELIGPKAIQDAVADKMSPLSALDDAAWEMMDEDWEAREHRDRQREKEDRKLREAEASDGQAGGRTAHCERRDTRLRSRSWRSWWV